MSIVPGTINIHGRIVTTVEWWSNGSGYALVLASLPLITSGFLLLMQSRYSRPIYIVGWVVVDSAMVRIAVINGAPLSKEEASIYGILCVLFIGIFAIYLYFSKAVKEYLSDVPSRRQSNNL